MEWLLIWIVATGHVNARIKSVTVERFVSQAECADALSSHRKTDSYHDGNGVCFPVAALVRSHRKERCHGR